MTTEKQKEVLRDVSVFKESSNAKRAARLGGNRSRIGPLLFALERQGLIKRGGGISHWETTQKGDDLIWEDAP